MKIIQITDTHLSPSKPHFNGNWEPLRDWILQTGADLIIHTGDLTVDGADHEDDIAFSLELMRQLPMPVLIVPGNHDVGHLPGSAQPVDAARLERWRRLAGPDYWVSDHGSWRLIGLNSLLFGHGDTEEDGAVLLAGRGVGSTRRPARRDLHPQAAFRRCTRMKVIRVTGASVRHRASAFTTC